MKFPLCMSHNLERGIFVTLEERTAFLRGKLLEGAHKEARIALPEDWDVSHLNCAISVKKALAIVKIFEKMPLYIGENELIVGSRTVYGHREEEKDKSLMEFRAMPHYINEDDIANFGGVNGESNSKNHYTPDYAIILKKGIDGIIRDALDSREKQSLQLHRDWLTSVIIVYEGISRLIERYALYAAELAEQADDERALELRRISDVCIRIAHHPAESFHEACQLFWFAHLGCLVENFQSINFGRVDVVLRPYYDTAPREEAQALVDCLLLKMYDCADITPLNCEPYQGQDNITLGGVLPNGDNAVSELTYAFIDGLSRTMLPQPEVSCRISSQNPPEYLKELGKLSVKGLNCLAYYNDDRFVENLTEAGIPLEYARGYGFDLCQDVHIPGRGDFFMSVGVSLTDMVLETMREHPHTFDDFWSSLKGHIAAAFRENFDIYNACEEAVRAYAVGDTEKVRRMLDEGTVSRDALWPFMSPLPVISALYHGCIQRGTDLSWFGCELGERGAFLTGPVVGINSIAALKKAVYEEKKYTIEEVAQACEDNFAGNEEMRSYLWNCPKWCNDDDYVDLPAKEICEFACREIMKYRTPTGARHLCGIHQPHPVPAGNNLGATPEGRKSREPIPVTLSPENGTMLNGPTAAMRSTAKLDTHIFQWNACVMLQYYSSVFTGNGGSELFAGLIKSYFEIGGMQHQPNIVSIDEIKRAQLHPEEYKDLIVRIYGISAHFVNLSRDTQDEFIARFGNM